MEKPVFVLEAKTAPNQWENIESLYPEIEIPSKHPSKESAFEAKSKLKTILTGKWRGIYKKRPIRIQEYTE